MMPRLLAFPLTSACMPSGEGKLEMAHEIHPAVTSTLTFYFWMIGYFLELAIRGGFVTVVSVQYGEDQVLSWAYVHSVSPWLRHLIIFIGRRKQRSAEIERSSLSLSHLMNHPFNASRGWSFFILSAEDDSSCEDQRGWAAGETQEIQKAAFNKYKTIIYNKYTKYIKQI